MNIRLTPDDAVREMLRFVEENRTPVPDISVKQLIEDHFGDGRIAYAPVEDLLFGFALVLATLAWWVFWGRRGVQATNPVGRD